MSDPDRIYLEPDHAQIEGRMWCVDDDPASLGEPWTEYVRADLYAALLEIVEETAKQSCRYTIHPCPKFWPEIQEEWCLNCRARHALNREDHNEHD